MGEFTSTIRPSSQAIADPKHLKTKVLESSAPLILIQLDSVTSVLLPIRYWVFLTFSLILSVIKRIIEPAPPFARVRPYLISIKHSSWVWFSRPCSLASYRVSPRAGTLDKVISFLEPSLSHPLSISAEQRPYVVLDIEAASVAPLVRFSLQKRTASSGTLRRSRYHHELLAHPTGCVLRL